MSKPTSEEILEALNTGKGLTVGHIEYVYQTKENGAKDYSNYEKIDHGTWPVLSSEVPLDAPEYVKRASREIEDYSNPIEYIISELISESDDLKAFGVPVESIERVGGEGEGDHAHVVVKVGDFFFRADFTYASWDGFYYDGAEFREVRPKEVVVIEYV